MLFKPLCWTHVWRVSTTPLGAHVHVALMFINGPFIVTQKFQCTVSPISMCTSHFLPPNIISESFSSLPLWALTYLVHFLKRFFVYNEHVDIVCIHEKCMHFFNRDSVYPSSLSILDKDLNNLNGKVCERKQKLFIHVFKLNASFNLAIFAFSQLKSIKFLIKTHLGCFFNEVNFMKVNLRA